MSLLKFFGESITSELAKKAESELRETEDSRNMGLKKMKELLKENSSLHPCTDDVFLLKFLRARKFDVENAYSLLIDYYKYKARYSGILTDFLPSDLELHIAQCQATILEHRTSKGEGILVLRPGTCDFKEYSLADKMAYELMVIDFGLEEEITQIAGYVVIIDFTGFDFQSIWNFMSLTALYRVFTALKVYLPCRMKAWHVVNEPWFIDFAIKLIQPILTEKVQKRVHVHGNNLKSLHEFITPEILPKEFGGRQGQMTLFNDQLGKKIVSREDYYARMIKYGYDDEIRGKFRKQYL